MLDTEDMEQSRRHFEVTFLSRSLVRSVIAEEKPMRQILRHIICETLRTRDVEIGPRVLFALSVHQYQATRPAIDNRGVTGQEKQT